MADGLVGGSALCGRVRRLGGSRRLGDAALSAGAASGSARLGRLGGARPRRLRQPRRRSAARDRGARPPSAGLGAAAAPAACAPSAASAAVAPLASLSNWPARTAFDGPSIIVMLRPSWSGRCSTTANSASSSARRSRIATPRSGWVTSRPRNMIVTLTLSLVAQEALDVALLGVVVVLGDLRAELDLADRDLLLVLARLLLLLRLLVLVLGVVEHAADGRLGLGRHLDEVEVALLRVAQRVVDLHHADLLAVLADQANLWNADALVDPGRIALWRAPVEPTRDRHYRSRARVKRSCVRGMVGVATAKRRRV